MAMGVARRHVERRVAVEEADRLEPERDGVDRHHRPLLRARDVVDPEHVPEHDVGVLDRTVLRGPHGQAAVLLALDHELAAGPALVRVERGHPERVGDGLRAAQHRRVRVHHRREGAARDELVADRRPERVGHVVVDDLPRALALPVVVLDALLLGAQRRVALHQREAVRVVGADRERLGLGGIDRVGLAVDVEVEPGDEEVLVERGVGPVVDERAVGRLVPLGEVRRDHDPGGADLALDVAVLVEAPVDEVLVVRHGDVEGEDEPARAADLRPVLRVDVLPEDGVVLLVDADRVRDPVGLAAGVVHDRVEVGDLAEAVAAELQRRGHEPEAPLADVERGAAVVVGGRVAVGDDHLREREAVGDRAAVVADRVQDHPLAVVEADAQRPLLPVQRVAVEREGDALGLDDLERLEVLAQPLAGHEVGDVLAHRGGLVDALLVLDLEQLHAVEVDHEVQPGDRVGVRARALLAAVPDVRPADAAAAVGLRDEVRAVGPGVDQHAVHLRDPAAGERLDDPRVAAQRRVALVELVDGHVRLPVGLVVPARDAILAERDDRLVDLAVVAVPADHHRLADDLVARREVADDRLGGLAQLDRREAPVLAHAALAAQDRRGQADLVRRQRVERVRRSRHADRGCWAITRREATVAPTNRGEPLWSGDGVGIRLIPAARGAGEALGRLR